jgi:hypothetical protein
MRDGVVNDVDMQRILQRDSCAVPTGHVVDDDVGDLHVVPVLGLRSERSELRSVGNAFLTDINAGPTDLSACGSKHSK